MSMNVKVIADGVEMNIPTTTDETDDVNTLNELIGQEVVKIVKNGIYDNIIETIKNSYNVKILIIW